MHLLSPMLGAALAVQGSVVVLPGGTPRPFSGRIGVRSIDAYFRGSAPNEFFNNSAQLILGSDLAKEDLENVIPSEESFVRGAIQAWGEHLHLVIRPDEVWFTILTQMTFYMVSHAEEIRNLFVDHQGQEVIYIEDYTWYLVLRRFKEEIQKRVKTPWLEDWITPSFSTSRETDQMVATILMMGLTKAYFKFEGGIICGLPSVTLLGEPSDWEKLLKKLDRLPDFGAEPAAYAARLKPILTRFVSSFRDPDSAETRAFWNDIVSAREGTICGDAPYYVSGWIAGFFYWDDAGKPYGRDFRAGQTTLDGVKYPALDIRRLPIGYTRAPFVMHNFSDVRRFEAYVAAGNMGKKITKGAPAGYAAALKRAGKDQKIVDAEHATLQSLSAWMLYGPIPHNKTEDRYVSDSELPNIVTSIRSGFDAKVCNKIERLG